MAATRGTRTKRTKSEIMSEFEKVADSVVDESQTSLQKSKESVAIDADLVRGAVAAFSVDGIVKNLASVKLEVNQSLGSLGERLIDECEKLEKLRAATLLESQEIERLYKIDVVAASLQEMLADYRKRESEINKAIENLEVRKDQLAQQHSREETEYRENLKKVRQREEDEYKYQTTLARKKDKDDFDQKMRDLEKASNQTQENLERTWREREQKIAAQEHEMERLKIEAASFPDRMQNEVKRNVADVTREIESRYEQKIQLMKKESETALKLAELKITTLSETGERQFSQIEILQTRLEEAKKQVQEIAMRAIDGASGARALTHVNQIAMEQAKGTRNPQG